MGSKSKLSLGALTALLIAVVLNAYWNRSSPVITLKSEEQLQGRIAFSRDGREYYEYLGIPYAEPPVGELRFKSPKPAKSWEGILTVKNFGSQCLQFDMITHLEIGEENCLYLNVHVPKLNKNKKLPVMVYIHGGYYVSGSSNIWRGKYLMDQDVILVTVNYRLGAFGFLNAGNDLARGNMGLKDQVMALKWIQTNIESFGGDKSKVTIWGQSAGSSCVHLLLLSTMTKGLFHRAISHSGTILSAWAMTHRPQEQAERFARKLNCSRKTSKEMVECLRKLPASEIVAIHRETADPLHEPLAVFKPSVESIKDADAFLAEHPYEIMKSDRIPNKVPWIVGANKEDGLAIASGVIRNETLLNQFEKDWEEIFARFLLYNVTDPKVSAKIRKYYFGNDDKIAKRENLDKFMKIFSDRQYFYGVHQCALYHSKSSPVFAYVFSQPNEFSFSNLLLSIGNTFHPMVYLTWEVTKFWTKKILFGTNAPFYGVAHVDEMSFILNMPLWPQFSQSNENYDFSVKFVKLWTSFAEKGVPDDIDDVLWPQFNHEDAKPTYLNLCNQSTLIKGPFNNVVKFWNSLNISDR